MNGTKRPKRVQNIAAVKSNEPISTTTMDCERLPIETIIERFHRLKKEKMFKPKDRALIHKQKFEKVISGKDSHPRHTDDSSVSDRRQNTDDADVEPKRRLSLPSLFHPFSPLTSTQSADDIRKLMEREEADEKQLTPRERRHSLSHVMQEYSKKSADELEQLTIIMKAKLDSIETRDGGDAEEEEEEEETYWYLSGEELHAFYNLWESSNSAERERVRTKLNKLRKKHREPVVRPGNGKTAL